MKKKLFVFLIFSALIATPILANSGGHDSGNVALAFLWIAVVLVLAKISGLVEKFGQPSVLGELIIGVLIGNAALLGINIFKGLGEQSIITFLSELGVVILLFQIGLESNIGQMKKVGLKAFLVAIIGVVVPFLLGTYVVGPLLMPGLEFNTYLFLGATLTATSVGITARVFKDLNFLKAKEAQIVLGAAVIDDVIGLIILAVVSAVVTAGSISLGSLGLITFKALGFLVGSIVIGQLAMPYLSLFFSKVNTGAGMKFTLAIAFGLIFAYLAHLIGLAPIVGAFAAGLILDPVHFKYFKDQHIVKEIKEAVENESSEVKEKVGKVIGEHSKRHIEELIEPIGLFFVPIFFVMTGYQVDLKTMFDFPTLLLALGITVAAFLGKIVSGLVSGKGANKWIVGFGMVPRGEVGLIFVMMGKALGVVSDTVFSAIVIMVIITTLLTPPILNFLIKKSEK